MAFLKQPIDSRHPDSRLCAFFALHHFTNGAVDKAMFFEKATNHYLTAFDPSAGVTKELAKSLVEDGNDPSVFQSFNMKQGDVAALEAKGVGIMAAGGHFFTVRKVHGQWTSFDSANHPAPKPYGSLAQLMKAEARNGQIWVGA